VTNGTDPLDPDDDQSGTGGVFGGYYRGGIACDTGAGGGAAAGGWGAALALAVGWLRRRR
jgi:hypothetical protein